MVPSSSPNANDAFAFTKFLFDGVLTGVLGFDDDNDSAPAGTRGPRRRGPRDEDEVIDLVGADEVIELPSDEDELA